MTTVWAGTVASLVIGITLTLTNAIVSATATFPTNKTTMLVARIVFIIVPAKWSEILDRIALHSSGLTDEFLCSDDLLQCIPTDIGAADDDDDILPLVFGGYL